MKMRAKYLVLAMALLCLLAVPPAAQAADDEAGKIDDSVATVLAATGGGDAVPVIVYTDPGAAGVVDQAVPRGVETTSLPGFDAVAAYLTEAEIDALAASDAVALIVADNPVFGFDYASSMVVTNLAIGLDKVAAPAAGGPSGAGVGVAILDSGIATTSDLQSSRIVGWKDLVNKRKAPYDDAGHGTFVAGLIAGDGTASLPLDQGGSATVQFRGVAPAADIVGVKVLDSTGQGRASAVMAGVLWALAHKDEYNIRVLNLSIGSNPVAPADFDPIAQAVELAWKNGITVVCAAGNEGEFGPGGILSPGNSPYVITVGATDTRQTASLGDDEVAFYSSVGPTLWDEYAKPDVVAPGNRLISLRVKGSYIDTEFPQNLIPVASYVPGAPADAEPSYLMLSGSSTSAPVGAGVAALMIGEDPDLSPDDVKVRLMGTADPLRGATRFEQGAGLIDAAGALASDAQAHGYALSEDVGDGTTILTKDDYASWDKVAWTKYGWTKFRWTKFRWTKFRWTEYQWTKFRWTVLVEGQ
ncbi:MAG: S8 family peptidase [Deltaproteobacteria bacterium]